MKRLQSLLKDLPGKDHNESTYRAITFLLAALCGTMPIAEHDGYKGRSDLEVVTGRFIYLFEFKYNKSAREALDQILDRDYIGRFSMDRRKVYLIGANFNEKKEMRGLEYEIAEGEVNDERLTINDERLTINDERSTIKDQRLTINLALYMQDVVAVRGDCGLMMGNNDDC